MFVSGLRAGHFDIRPGRNSADFTGRVSFEVATWPSRSHLEVCCFGVIRASWLNRIRLGVWRHQMCFGRSLHLGVGRRMVH